MIKFIHREKQISKNEFVKKLIEFREYELMKYDLTTGDYLTNLKIGLQDDVADLMIFFNSKHTVDGFRIESDMSVLDVNIELLIAIKLELEA
jgi:uncharacterized ubiquitin-like protein YukD